MFPILFRFKTPEFLQGLFPEYITVYSYGFMILTGILAAWVYMWYRRKDFNLNNDSISEIFLYSFIGVFVGGKLFFYLEEPGKYLKDPSAMFEGLGSGFVFYGSFLVAIPVLIYHFKKKGLAVLPMFDLMAIGGSLVHGFGKIGCLLAGCCHGRVCQDGPSITFTHPESTAEPLNTPLYPVQVYDSMIILGISVLLMILYKRKQFNGQLILLYAMIYGVGRTITEVYRGDEERGYIIEGVLTHSQFIAVLILAGTAWLWIRWRRTHVVGVKASSPAGKKEALTR